MQDDRTQKLLEEYRGIFQREGNPAWAVDVNPSILFVGQGWVPGEGILVYASAENLAGNYPNAEGTVLKTNPWDRHRAHFEEWKVDAQRSAFPSVHIQPVSDGPLQVVAAFVRTRAGLACPADPALALELGAFANFAKFAIKSDGPNVDHATDFEKLCASLPYVQADFETLEPRFVVLPRTMFDTLKWAVERSLPGASQWAPLVNKLSLRALPATQANQRALNHLAKVEAIAAHALALEARFRAEGAPWLEWVPRVRGVNEPTIWRLLAEIDLAAGGRFSR